MSPEGETEVVLEKPKRAPRKRAPKVVSDDASEKAPVKRAPRKRAPKKVDPPVEEVVEERVSARKAPTPIAAERTVKKKSRRQWYVMLTMVLLGVGASAGVGITDKGAIDVGGVIAQKNEEARAAGRTESIIPVQNTPVLPDGGLTGLGDLPTTQSAPAATTTGATASSTEAIPSPESDSATTTSSQ